MAVIRNITATLLGAAAANLLPFLFLQAGMSSVSAKWAWMTSPPKCASAAPSTWDFGGMANIAAGATANVTCKNGGTASVATVSCPSTNEAATQPAQDPDWWGPCGFGDSCLQDMSIGSDVTCTGGTSTDAGGSVRFAVSGASAVVGLLALQ